MYDAIIFGNELSTLMTEYLQQDTYDNILIIGKIPDLRVLRVLRYLEIDFYQAGDLLYSVDKAHIDLSHSEFLGTTSHWDCFKRLKEFNLICYDFVYKNIQTGITFNLREHLSENSIIKFIGEPDFKLSSAVPKQLLNLKCSYSFHTNTNYIIVDFEDTRLLPDNYKTLKQESGLYYFTLGSKELSSLLRRFIAQSSLNIRSISLPTEACVSYTYSDNSNANTLVISDINAETLSQINALAREGKLAEVFSTNDIVQTYLEEKNIMNRRW